MAFLSALRIALLGFLTFLSFVLYGIACAALATDQLRGDPATAIVAFAGGITALVVPGWRVAFSFSPVDARLCLVLFVSNSLALAATRPAKFPATTWFFFSYLSTLFVFYTAGLATFTGDTSSLRASCASPPPVDFRSFEFDLLCTLSNTILGVGWTAWTLLTLLILFTGLFVVRRWWWRDQAIAGKPAGELWEEGWWKPWQHAGKV
ncbi:hypothetical protein JCM10207_005299 [Rhodosporidiobolus poonsookiae]